jgi:hypothetical protein
MLRGVSRRFRRQSPEEEPLPPEEDIAHEQEPVLVHDLDDVEDDLVDEPADVRPRRAMRTEVRTRVLLVILVIVVALALVAFNVTDQIPSDLLARWPWVFVIAGVLWLLVGLVTAWPHGTLGGPLVVAVGIAALLDQEQVLSGVMTFSGVLLIAVGFAVILRGLTMPRV